MMKSDYGYSTCEVLIFMKQKYEIEISDNLVCDSIISFT